MAQKEGTSDLQHNGYSAELLMNGDTDMMAISPSELDNMFEKEPNLLSKAKVPAPWTRTIKVNDSLCFIGAEVYGHPKLKKGVKHAKKRAIGHCK